MKQLLDLLEDRERKHDAFRLAEQRGGEYYEELSAFDAAHGEVVDWVNDHPVELLEYLRAHRDIR